EATRQANMRVEKEIQHLEEESIRWEENKAQRIAKLQAEIAQIEATDPQGEIEILTEIEALESERNAATILLRNCEESAKRQVTLISKWNIDNQLKQVRIQNNIKELESVDVEAVIAGIKA